MQSLEIHSKTNSIFYRLFLQELKGNVLYKEYYGTSGQTLDLIENDIYVEFAMIGSEQVSKCYRVASLTNTYNPFSADVANHDKNTAVYSFRLDEPLGEDVNFINNDPSGQNGSAIENLAILNIYKYNNLTYVE